MQRRPATEGILMATRPATELERLLERLEKQREPLDDEFPGRIALEISKVFRVRADEVAVLGLSAAGKVLKFVLPTKLQTVGSIPMTSTTALAARTARERRTDILNNFASARHASVFEGVPLDGHQGESIQKIMSVPILQGDRVIGVAQISRKGNSAAESGPDFTSKDLGELQGLNAVLGRFLALCRIN
jgi:hypothetical protein